MKIFIYALFRMSVAAALMGLSALALAHSYRDDPTERAHHREYAAAFPLHHAVIDRSSSGIEMLLHAGADMNTLDQRGFTPLMLAANRLGSNTMVKILLAAGANPNATNEEGWTALIIATQIGRHRAANLLLEAGADANAESDGGFTALMAAARDDRPKIAKMLLDADANPNAENENDWQALMHAALNDNLEVAEILLAAGADIDAENDDDKTALDIAKEKGHDKMVALLQKAEEESSGSIGLWLLLAVIVGGVVYWRRQKDKK